MSRILRTDPGPALSKAVEYHGFVYTQGVVARNPELDIRGQVRDVLAQIEDVLEAHGTDKTRLLQAQIWLKHVGDCAALDEIWTGWLLEGQAPARAVVQAELGDPRWLVEIMLTTCK